MIPDSTTQPAASPLSRLGFWIAIAVLTLLGAWLRAQGLTERPLWGDEIYTIAHAVGQWVPDWVNHAQQLQPAAIYQEKLQYVPRAVSLFEGLDRTTKVLIHNNHPPLFFGVMGMWLQSVGVSLLSLRWPAYACGVISIPLFAFWARALAGTRIALFSTLLWVFSGYQLFQAQNARPYTLITCLVLLVAWGWIPLAYGKARYRQFWWPTVVGASLLALHTHYFSLPAIAALWVMGILHWPGRTRTPVWIALGVLLLGSLPIGWLLWQQWQSPLGMGATGHFTQATTWPLYKLPELIFRMANDHLMPKLDASKWLLLGMTILTATLGFKHWWAYQKEGYKEQPQWLSPKWVWPLAWFVGVFGFQVILDMLSHGNSLTVRRYTLLAAPATTLLVTLMAAWLPRHIGLALNGSQSTSGNGLGRFIFNNRGLLFSVLMAVLISMAAINGWQVAQRNTFANPDLRLAARMVGQQPSRIPVYVWPGNVRLLSAAWYLPAETPMATFTPKQGLPTQPSFEGADLYNAWVLWIKPSGSALKKAKAKLAAQGWQQVQFSPADKAALHQRGVALWQLTKPMPTTTAGTNTPSATPSP